MEKTNYSLLARVPVVGIPRFNREYDTNGKPRDLNTKKIATMHYLSVTVPMCAALPAVITYNQPQVRATIDSIVKYFTG